MWYLILLITISSNTVMECKPIEELIEGPLWLPQLAFIYPKDLLGRRTDRVTTYNQRDLQQQEQQLYSSDDDETDDYDLLLPKFTNNKRALAMIGRWGPFSNIGKQRTPIRSNPGLEIDANINTQTRARMQGQPLRWG